MTATPFWTCPPGESCGNCGEPIERIWNYEEPPPVGDLLVCVGCGAIHEVIPDGVRYTGNFVTISELKEHQRGIVFGKGDMSG